MEYILLFSTLFCSVCYGQIIINDKPIEPIEIDNGIYFKGWPSLRSGKDTVYNEVVPAKFYLYINDSTIKVVYGRHNYSVHEHPRGQYWHEYVEPDYSDSFADFQGVDFYTAYPGSIVLKCEDLAEPKIYNTFKFRLKVRYA